MSMPNPASSNRVIEVKPRGVLHFIALALKQYGIDFPVVIANLKNLNQFVLSVQRYRQLGHVDANVMRIAWKNLRPIMSDYGTANGSFDHEYFYQDWWVARQIFLRSPATHLDIGSRLDGFIAHLLTFRQVDVVDIRPVDIDIPGLSTIIADATSMPGIPDESIDSVSCLHTIEHLGLGRYGDPIDPYGPIRAAREIVRILKPGGNAYISAPIGRERLEFNAQRVFAPAYLPKLFNTLSLKQFVAIDDEGSFRENSDLSDFDQARDACGIYMFQKESQPYPSKYERFLKQSS